MAACYNTWTVAFWVTMLYTLGMKAVNSSKSLVTTYDTTWCHNPEDNNPYFHSREELRSLLRLLFVVLHHRHQSFEPNLIFCRKQQTFCLRTM
jgi:hypothetical protein